MKQTKKHKYIYQFPSPWIKFKRGAKKKLKLYKLQNHHPRNFVLQNQPTATTSKKTKTANKNQNN